MREAPDYQALYQGAYDACNSERTLAGRFLQKSHRVLEDSLLAGLRSGSILEVGAGSGHHYGYVDAGHGGYVLTDASDQMLDLARRRHAEAVAAGRLRIERQDATRLGYPDHAFDRLIAAHILEHLPEPVAVLREWNRVVRPGGCISIVLPCDPGMLWRLGRNLGPRRHARRLGLPYDYLMAAEHVSSIFNLTVFIRHHFDLLAETWYPLRIPCPDVNLFYACHLKV